MTPFKRLTETGGKDPWLESAAETVRAGDPWAAVSDQRAAQVGAAALRRVRSERDASRPGHRRLVFAAAVLASSFALAALGRYAVQVRADAAVAKQPVAPQPAPLAPLPEAPTSAPAAPPAVAEAPTGAPKPAAPAPVKRPSVTDRASSAAAAAPEQAVAEPSAAVSASATERRDTADSLDAEAQLLLAALRQLKVEQNPDAALATLERYAARFPDGALKNDAEAARQEALALKASKETP